MCTRLGQSFGIGFFALILVSSHAFADPAADTALGQQALDNEEIVKAETLFRQAAEQNYLPAQDKLGEILHASQQDEEAVGWYMTAAYQGDAAAAYDLGEMYAVGNGIEKSFAKAVYWITHAADKNYLSAVQALVTAYNTGGLGLAKDPEKAQQWAVRLIALKAAAQKEFDEKLDALKEQRREARKAAAEKAAAEKAAAEKAAAEKAAD